MPMPWARMDNNWQTNHKFVALAAERQYHAITVYWGGVAHCSAQGLGGFIPAAVLRIIWGTPRIAATLIEVGLWEPVDGGWQIHDWDEYQLSDTEVADRRKRARNAAMIRWHGDKK
jgi:hypothetical protein